MSDLTKQPEAPHFLTQHTYSTCKNYFPKHYSPMVFVMQKNCCAWGRTWIISNIHMHDQCALLVTRMSSPGVPLMRSALRHTGVSPEKEIQRSRLNEYNVGYSGFMGWGAAVHGWGLPTFRKKASHIVGVRFVRNTRGSEIWRRGSHLPSKGRQELDHRRQWPSPQDKKTPTQRCQTPNESCCTHSHRTACVHGSWYLEPNANQK